MASLVSRPNNNWWVQFGWQKKRHTVRLGKCSQKDAMRWHDLLEQLIEARKLSVAESPVVQAWLGTINQKHLTKLRQAGLVGETKAKPGEATIADLIVIYKANMQQRLDRGEAKIATERNARVVCENIVKHFGNDATIVDFGYREAEGFKTWLTNKARRRGGELAAPLKRTTVSRRCRRAREIFEFAVEEGWIEKNPFQRLRMTKETNHESCVYVPRDQVDLLIKSTYDLELRLLLAFARYGGVQMPSEMVGVKITDVDTSKLLVTIHKPKVEHHEGKGFRQFPLWPEVEPHFQALFAILPPGETYLFPSYRKLTGAAITKRCHRTCQESGVIPWTRFFVNMRASCEEDLMASYPITDVAAWLGHSPKVALQHYSRSVEKNSASKAAHEAKAASGPKITSLFCETPKAK